MPNPPIVVGTGFKNLRPCFSARLRLLTVGLDAPIALSSQLLSAIQRIDPVFIPLQNHPPLQLHARRQLSALDAPLLRHHAHLLQHLMRLQLLIHLLHNLLVQLLHLRVLHKLRRIFRLHTIRRRPPPRFSAGRSGEISTAANFRESPITAAFPTNSSAFSFPSIGCGAMYFPLLVLITSFFRSVIERNPPSYFPISPVLNHPSSVNSLFVASSLCQYPANTVVPRPSISPSSAMRNSRFGITIPTVPIL